MATDAEKIGDDPARQGGFVIARDDLTIAHAHYAPGQQVAGRHIHHEHIDAFYVLEGELSFEIGSEAETITVGAGGFVAAPPGLAHSFRVADSGPARWLTIHAPDGGFAAFMRGLRDGVEVEWDIAPVPADGGLPASEAVTNQGASRSGPRPAPVPRRAGQAARARMAAAASPVFSTTK